MTRKTIGKTTIGIILASTMVASAVVYAAVTHHHRESAAITSNLPAPQLPAIPKPAAGTPFNADADPSQADAASDPNAQQNAAAADQNQNPSQEQPDPEQPDQNQPGQNQPDGGAFQPAAAPVLTVHRRNALYASAAVETRSPVRVRPVRAAHPAVSVSEASLELPAAPAAAIRKASSSPIVVPAGTELTLRLNEPLGSRISHINQVFSATLDRDVDIHGLTAIPAGSEATGKVVFARLAGRFAGEANLQVEIDSIKIKRHEFEVHTTVRSFGPIVEAKNKVGRFMKGIAKRMDGEEHDVLLEDQTAYTFNLSEPLELR